MPVARTAIDEIAKGPCVRAVRAEFARRVLAEPRGGEGKEGRWANSGVGRKHRVIDFCRGFGRRYPFYRVYTISAIVRTRRHGGGGGRRDAAHRLAVTVPRGRR